MQQRSSITRNRILDTARELFLARNFGEVTVDQVAEGAQTTKGGVYHHFGSKEELYLAMLHRDLEQKAALFARSVEMENQPVPVRPQLSSVYRPSCYIHPSYHLARCIQFRSSGRCGRHRTGMSL